jgi:hypothetical protein
MEWDVINVKPVAPLALDAMYEAIKSRGEWVLR